jgi:hypothetical protein
MILRRHNSSGHNRVGDTWVCIFVGLLLLGASTGCDERASVTLEPSVQNESILQTDALRAFVPPASISSIYRTRSPGGLTVSATAVDRTIGDTSTTIGPFSTTLAVDNWSVSPTGDTWPVAFEIDQPTVTIPVRIQQTAGVRICRFQARADQMRLEASISIFDDSDDATALAPDSPVEPGYLVTTVTPTLDADALQFDIIGDCPPLLDNNESLSTQTDLLAILETYLRGAVQSSTEDKLELSPVEGLGLLRGSVTLNRRSQFESRLGELSYSARTEGANGSDDPGVTLNQSGLHLDMAGGVSSFRAPCFPPDPSPSLNPTPANTPTPASLSDPNTDVAVAVSTSLIERLLQSAALGGFYCLGLEPPANTTASPIPQVTASDMQLGDVGLGHLPVSGRLDLAISPGSFPSVAFRPRDNVVQASWPDLTIDVYGRVDGTRVRMLEVTTTVEFGMRPHISDQNAQRAIPFQLESLSVSDVSFDSDWRRSDTAPPELTRWSRRLANLTFEGAFSLPLPFAPMRSVNLTSATVRQQDLLVGWALPNPSDRSP